MDLTIHAVERIQGRTKMLIRDVLSIIAEDKAMSLGSADGYEFLLFYSPADLKLKVAVVTEDRSHLISIWEKNYRFPEGIEITKENRAAVYSAHFPAPLRVEIHVQNKGRTEFVFQAGTMTADRAFDADAVLADLASALTRMSDAIEQNRLKITGKIKFYIWLFDPDSGDPVKHYSFKQPTLRRLFRLPTTPV